MAIGDRVKERRTALGLSQAELAQRVGVTQQAINNLETGISAKSRHIVEIADALETTPAYLESKTDDPGPFGLRPARLAPVPTANYMPQDVPVLGQVVGGDDADFEFNGETIDYIRRPNGISRMRDVFGLYTTGSSMWPKFEEGEPIYVSASRPPAIGDYVVVELHPADEASRNGPGYIKRLKKRTPTKIVVEQFNPPKDIEFDQDQIKAIFRVIPLAELVGV
ncbi:MAG: helix-turn-helix transcriptional regulator [Mesorhizobium sp.]|nr:helix-turn-helix domain-containing protein [Mesorhizobium sp.]MBL8578112.1 helix-turn-helix transcriptional regulator [Mesorhizobium sp.]